MFLGTHTPKLDEKGRLFLPARFREELAEGVVITKGQERCLYVFKRADFLDQAAKLQAAPITAKAARAVPPPARPEQSTSSAPADAPPALHRSDLRFS